MLYSYYCENIYYDSCFFNKEKIAVQRIFIYYKILVQAKNLTISNNTLQHSTIYISEENNKCHKINNDFSNSYNNNPNQCSVIAIVKCNGEIECSYSISFNGVNSHKLLKENTPEQGYLDFMNIVYFKININEVEVDEVDIIVNAVVGDLDVAYSLVEKFPNFSNRTGKFLILNLDMYNHLANIPDFIRIKRKEKDNAIGQIYLAVKGKTTSSYNILYRSKSGSTSDKDNLLRLHNGVIIKDFIGRSCFTFNR